MSSPEIVHFAYHGINVGDGAVVAGMRRFLDDAFPGHRYQACDLLPFTSYRNRPKDWLSEWVALHHSHCIVGEGIRRWLDQVPGEEARETLAELVGGYPQTRAAAAAREWLSAGPGRGR